MPKETDRELLRAARAGNPDAFGTLVERHQRRIYRLALHMLKNEAEAEDVAQDTFIRAYRALDRFDGRSAPFTWIYRIAVNLSLNRIRARKTRKRTSLSPDDPRLENSMIERNVERGDPARTAADRELAQTLFRGLDSLSETLRTTMIMVSIEGVSHAEAAEILGCPEGTVAWRIHEARKKLRAYLRQHGIEEEEA